MGSVLQVAQSVLLREKQIMPNLALVLRCLEIQLRLLLNHGDHITSALLNFPVCFF